MEVEYNSRGFQYLSPSILDIRQSSAIGDYDHSMDVPGSSYLWLLDGDHYDKDDVEALVKELEETVEHLRAWLNTGSLEVLR